MKDNYRKPLIISHPYIRLDNKELEAINRASLYLLENIGIICHNQKAIQIFNDNGCAVNSLDQRSARIRLPESIVRQKIDCAPSQVILGARDPKNKLLLDAKVPGIYFGSGAETNIWLETTIESYVNENNPSNKKQLPTFHEKRGSLDYLAKAAKLGEALDHLDFFIRPVNTQDEEITEDNHDINKFFVCFNNITKHVQAGLTKLEQLPNVLKLAEIIAGGKQNLKENPVLSFITCLIKSPLEMVDDTTEKLISIAEAGLPVVISSSPQGGTTAPITEAGMVSQINAEILCGIALSQMVNPGTPVIYGSVPVRARMDDLHDLYGAPEFNQYNIDCVQMARYYDIPCYSTAGVGDSNIPGMQSIVEKLFTYIPIAMSGAQYIHYAFGLLDRTNIFCPVQAVLDNEHIGMIKAFLKKAEIHQGIEEAKDLIEKVMHSQQRLYARYSRKYIKKDSFYPGYPFESKNGKDEVIVQALETYHRMMKTTDKNLSYETIQLLYKECEGLLPQLLQSREGQPVV